MKPILIVDDEAPIRALIRLTLERAVRGGTVFTDVEETTVWICRNCGHITVGKQAPLVCPVCSHPQSYFQRRAENY